jgi:GTP-binding protein LepA
MTSFDKAQDKQSHIRNFAIIAHIDHGKSTLADRMLEMTGTIQKRQMQEQILDSNPIERERGITISLAPVRMHYKEHILNLIDTPGHVDFGYEVSRSLAACEGAVLVVDATQGVQAQTLANLAQARRSNLKIIPVINKIDMANARIEETVAELVALDFTEDEILKISAKTGEGVQHLLDTTIERVPAPIGNPDAPTRALVFTSYYDSHKGIVVFVRLIDGSIHFDAQTRLLFLASDSEVTPIEIGYFNPEMKRGTDLLTGEVGYIATGLKDIRFAKVGDTVTNVVSKSQRINVSKSEKNSDTLTPDTLIHGIQPLPGYKEPQSMVFLGLFPINSEDINIAREAMDRLRLSDSAFSFRPIFSLALGNGFHCGFLGLLHAEIVQERLSREFNLNMLATTPSVEYKLKLKSSSRSSSFAAHPSVPSLVSSSVNPKEGATVLEKTRHAELDAFISIQSAAEYPDPSFIEEAMEPVMEVKIYSPKRYVGPVMQLASSKRGQYIDLTYLLDQATFTYLIPLSEMIIDFFDQLKSITEGYASLDYEFFDYQPVKLVKLDILVNKEKVDALSFLTIEETAVFRGREIVDKLAEVIPRKQFLIPIQAAIGGQIIGRADVKPFRKDVISKLYGGDRSRKDKLLDKQKKGKSKMKSVGNVEIPQDAFLKVLRRS